MEPQGPRRFRPRPCAQPLQQGRLRRFPARGLLPESAPTPPPRGGPCWCRKFQCGREGRPPRPRGTPGGGCRGPLLCGVAPKAGTQDVGTESHWPVVERIDVTDKERRWTPLAHRAPSAAAQPPSALWEDCDTEVLGSAQRAGIPSDPGPRLDRVSPALHSMAWEASDGGAEEVLLRTAWTPGASLPRSARLTAGDVFDGTLGADETPFPSNTVTHSCVVRGIRALLLSGNQCSFSAQCCVSSLPHPWYSLEKETKEEKKPHKHDHSVGGSRRLTASGILPFSPGPPGTLPPEYLHLFLSPSASHSPSPQLPPLRTCPAPFAVYLQCSLAYSYLHMENNGHKINVVTTTDTLLESRRRPLVSGMAVALLCAGQDDLCP